MSCTRLSSSRDEKPDPDDSDGDGIDMLDAFLDTVRDAAVSDTSSQASVNMRMRSRYNFDSQGYGRDCDDDHSNTYDGGNANGNDYGN